MRIRPRHRDIAAGPPARPVPGRQSLTDPVRHNPMGLERPHRPHWTRPASHRLAGVGDVQRVVRFEVAARVLGAGPRARPVGQRGRGQNPACTSTTASVSNAYAHTWLVTISNTRRSVSSAPANDVRPETRGGFRPRCVEPGRDHRRPDLAQRRRHLGRGEAVDVARLGDRDSGGTLGPPGGRGVGGRVAAQQVRREVRRRRADRADGHHRIPPLGQRPAQPVRRVV
jgi:hypothetical protein